MRRPGPRPQERKPKLSWQADRARWLRLSQRARRLRHRGPRAWERGVPPQPGGRAWLAKPLLRTMGRLAVIADSWRSASDRRTSTPFAEWIRSSPYRSTRGTTGNSRYRRIHGPSRNDRKLTLSTNSRPIMVNPWTEEIHRIDALLFPHWITLSDRDSTDTSKSGSKLAGFATIMLMAPRQSRTIHPSRKSIDRSSSLREFVLVASAMLLMNRGFHIDYLGHAQTASGHDRNRGFFVAMSHARGSVCEAGSLETVRTGWHQGIVERTTGADRLVRVVPSLERRPDAQQIPERAEIVKRVDDHDRQQIARGQSPRRKPHERA